MIEKLILALLVFVNPDMASSQSITVMTYNIRYDNPDDGENKWDNRKNLLAGQIKFYEPDIFGIQEGLIHQVSYLDSSLANYTFVGVGRDNGADQGEFSAIFYDTLEFSLMSHSTFWLSETPDTVSTGWDAALERICTYGLFKHVLTKRKLWIFNTHFDHKGERARTNSARLIIDRINTLNKNNYPVILMGDLNLEPGSEPIQYLSGELQDTKYTSSEVPFGPSGTFNGFRFDQPVTRRIDYIFTSKNNTRVIKYAVLSDSKDCKYLSDHLPVYAEITIYGTGK